MRMAGMTSRRGSAAHATTLPYKSAGLPPQPPLRQGTVMGTAARPLVCSDAPVGGDADCSSAPAGGRAPLRRLTSSTPAHVVGVCLVADPLGRAA